MDIESKKNKIINWVSEATENSLTEPLEQTVFFLSNLQNHQLINISQAALCSLSDTYLNALLLARYFHIEGVQAQEAEDAYYSIAVSLAKKAGYYIPENILNPYFIGIIPVAIDIRLDNELTYKKLQKAKTEIQTKPEEKSKRTSTLLSRHKWRIACIALACVMVIGITVGSANPTIREAVMEVLSGQKAQQVVAHLPDKAIAIDDLANVICPKALLHGYAVYKTGDFSKNYTLLFSNQQTGEEYIFELRRGSFSSTMDAEYSTAKKVYVNGRAAYFLKGKDTICIDCYLSNDILFSLSADLSTAEADLLEIARSVRR